VGQASRLSMTGKMPVPPRPGRARTIGIPRQSPELYPIPLSLDTGHMSHIGLMLILIPTKPKYFRNQRGAFEPISPEGACHE
jgi:hypothetical protein